jgi:hypothetical protein
VKGAKPYAPTHHATHPVSLSFRLAPSGAGWFIVNDLDGAEILITWPHISVLGHALLEPVELSTDSVTLNSNGAGTWLLRDKHTRMAIVMAPVDMQRAGHILVNSPKPREDSR